jgi:molybdenum cofactor guanylyltransferase
MGSRKGDLVLADGITMAARAIDTLDGVCIRVVAVGQPLHSLRLVEDIRPGSGPLGGIESLLTSGLDTDYLICGIDTPLLTSDLLRKLTKPTDADATIFSIEDDSRTQSLPMRISSNVAPEVSRSLDLGERAIHRFLETIDVEAVTITQNQAVELTNVNNPDDYARIAKE